MTVFPLLSIRLAADASLVAVFPALAFGLDQFTFTGFPRIVNALYKYLAAFSAFARSTNSTKAHLLGLEICMC